MFECMVTKVGPLKTSGYSRYVECETDCGIVAVWSKAGGANAPTVARALPPFRLKASHTSRTSRSEHQVWIPAHADIAITRDKAEEISERQPIMAAPALPNGPGPERGPSETIFSELATFLKSLDGPTGNGPATLLYNEGWLLRLVLAAASRGIRCLPHPFEPGARWFSEARLYTPFAPRRRGDLLGESVTNADGVIGHFEIGTSSKAGLHLTADGTQFIIVEAKMFSGLSKGTTRAATYDQAARNVACLAHAVAASKQTVESFRSLGFWVLAPATQIDAGVFACATRESVELRIRERVEQYEVEWQEKQLNAWIRDALAPVLDRLEISCLPWEQVIADVKRADPNYGDALQAFYDLCVLLQPSCIESEGDSAAPRRAYRARRYFVGLRSAGECQS